MSYPQEKLHLAIDLSNQIIELTRQKDWPEVDKLNQQRMELLEAVFSDTALDLKDEKSKGLVQRLIQLNNKALEICANSKRVMQANSQKLRRGKEAISAYHKQLSLN